MTGPDRERRVFDISPPLTANLAVFPGDTPLGREVLLRREDGASVTLSTLRATVHLGAHVDAPSHYGTGAATIEATPLARLLGPCTVVRPGSTAGRVSDEDLADALAGRAPAERVLVATDSYVDPNRWTPGFTSLAPEAIDWLAGRGVRTIGVDTPSVDAADSKDLPAHAAVLRHGMTILEGLVLADVPAGSYELIALPLRLVGFDGSPVRAVLRELSPD